MKYAVTGKQMKAIDEDTINRIGIPSVVLMERAALAVAGAAETLMAGRYKKSRQGLRRSAERGTTERMGSRQDGFCGGEAMRYLCFWPGIPNKAQKNISFSERLHRSWEFL